jgi:hypothetical protein
VDYWFGPRFEPNKCVDNAALPEQRWRCNSGSMRCAGCFDMEHKTRIMWHHRHNNMGPRSSHSTGGEQSSLFGYRSMTLDFHSLLPSFRLSDTISFFGAVKYPLLGDPSSLQLSTCTTSHLMEGQAYHVYGIHDTRLSNACFREPSATGKDLTRHR